MKLAILDGGFQPDMDTPPGWQAVSNIPFRDAIGTKSLGFCPDTCDWHGTNVVSAATAATGTGATIEVISPQPRWPFGALWRPGNTFDTETWCGLDGRPIRLNLQVVGAEGRTASDHIVLPTYPCPVVD